jgi:hypothetical protein
VDRLKVGLKRWLIAVEAYKVKLLFTRVKGIMMILKEECYLWLPIIILSGKYAGRVCFVQTSVSGIKAM